METSCQSIITGAIDVSADVSVADDLFAAAAGNGLDATTVPSLSAAQEKVGLVRAKAAAESASLQFDRQSEEIAAAFLAIGGAESVVDVDVARFPKVTAVLAEKSVKTEGEGSSGTKIKSVLETGRDLVYNSAVPKAPVLTNKAIGSLERVLTDLKAFWNSLTDHKDLAPVNDLIKISGLMDSLAALRKVVELGPDTNVRFQTDPSLKTTRAGAAAHKKLAEFATEAGESTPGWLKAAIQEAATLLGDFGDHVLKLKSAPIEDKVAALQVVAKVPPFFNADASHWLDDSHFLATEDVDELEEFLRSTLFTVPIAPFQLALESATVCRDELAHVIDTFGVAAPDAKKELDDAIHVARITKAEIIVLALIVEHQTKPIRLKRAIKDHMQEFSDVWASVHSIVERAAELFSTTSAKEPKVLSF